MHTKSTTSPVKWFKQWVTQDVVATGGKCRVLKWVNEATLKDMKEKKELQVPEAEPEPTTEVLFLCSYEGCGKTFVDAGALRKHCQIHSERQYICHYEGCGKKFVDSSKLKRHSLVHTGEREFICPYEGCGKEFSLDFNLRAHMRTHTRENYLTCPSPDCGQRYAHEYKLKNHIASHHEKDAIDTCNYTPPAVKQQRTPCGLIIGRPHACPYDGCEKAYVHAYKLNLHLRREHPGHFPDKNAKNAQLSGNEKEELSDQEAFGGKHRIREFQKQSSRTNKPSLKQPPSKVAGLKGSSASPANLSTIKKPCPVREETFGEEDSEETADERDNVGDEETDYED